MKDVPILYDGADFAGVATEPLPAGFNVGALAASIFHSGEIPIPKLKAYLQAESIEVRV